MSATGLIERVIILDEDALPMAVQNGVALPANTRGFISVGLDGSGSVRFVSVDSGGRLQAVGAGAAGAAVAGNPVLVGGSDGSLARYLSVDSTGRLNIKSEVQIDYDSGAGTQSLSVVGLALPASGGAVAGGTSTNPLRTDPTGTTTQPVSDGGGSLTVDGTVTANQGTGAAAAGPWAVRVSDGAAFVTVATDRTTAAGPFAVRLSTGSAFYDAPTSAQLPSALVGGRLDANVGAWFGSTAPTVGSKTAANSIPVVIASDQTPGNDRAAVTGSLTALNQTVAINTQGCASCVYSVTGTWSGNLTHEGTLDGTTWTAIHGQFLGTTTQFVGTTNNLTNTTTVIPCAGFAQVRVRMSSFTSGTANITMTAAKGQMSQPIYSTTANSFAVNVAQWMGSNAPSVGQKTSNTSVPVVLASDDATFLSQSIVDNAAFTDGTTRVVPAGFIFDETAGTALTENDAAAARIDSKRATIHVIEDGTTRGTRAAVKAASTAAVATDPALVVAVSPNNTLPINVASWIGSSAPTVGQKAMASSVPVVVASDQSAVPVVGNAANGAAASGNPVLTAGLDGSTARTIRCRSDGTQYVELSGSSVQAVLIDDYPAFTVTASAVAIGNNKSMIALLNGATSTHILRVREIYVLNSQTGAVTGVVARMSLRRITGFTGGTALTPVANDTNDTLDAQVTAATGATVSGEATAFIQRGYFSTDEWGTGTLDVEALQATFQTYNPFFRRADTEMRPLTLRAGQGLTLKCETNSTAGAFDLIVIFTQET